MALLRKAANVHCNDYFPRYYSTGDPILGAEGSTWTSSNDNSELKSDHHHNGALPVLSSVNLSGYNKEILKQTILKHEAIFRDQIHELHRVYQKQRELMDELYRHNLRLETSWPSSSLSHVSLKSAERVCSLPNLPWLTGQSSVLIAESTKLPLGSLQEKSSQVIPAPSATPTKRNLEDSKLLESRYRKVGRKILDLQLPADEYIDSEGELLKDEKVSEVPKVPTYTLDRISQVVCSTDETSCGVDIDSFAGLNESFKLKEKAAAKSDGLMVPTHHRNMPFHDLSRKTNLGTFSFSYNVIQIQRKDPAASSYDPPQNHEQLSSINSAGHCSLDQINQGSQCERKFSGGERSAGTQVSTSNGLLGSSSALCMYVPYQPFSEAGMRSSGISSPVVSWKTPLSDLGQSPVSVQSLSCVSNSAHFDQSSKVLMGMPGLTGGDKFHQCKSVKSGPNLDSQNFSLSSFCSRPKTSDGLPISTYDLSNCYDHGSSFSHEYKKFVKGGSEDVGPPKNINLNIIPDGSSDTMALESIQITDVENKFQESRRGLPWLKEKPVPKEKPNEESKISAHLESVLSQPSNSVGIHGFELTKIEETDMSGEKILAFDANGKPNLFSDLLSPHVSPTKVCQNRSEDQKFEEIEKGCVSDVNLPVDEVLDMGEHVPGSEHFMKDELEKKHKRLTAIIDLNSCLNEDENMPMDIDFQAPVSPENKECSPPRGESDENQVEMPYQLAGKEDAETQEEHVRIAAEALVSISAFATNSSLQMITCPPSDYFPSGPLHWFARIVSLVSDNAENEVKVDFSGCTDDLEELLPPGIDYFEAMTLKLTETKVLDCCCKSSDQNEEDGGSTSPTQPRKGRTNRGRQRKDFQSEILPSLASLSRYEVTEDLQTIGGLMEAAGTLLETGSLRSAGRNALARGRRRSSASALNVTDVPMKELTGNAESGIEKRGQLSWGKVNRKPRGQRFPAKNRQIVFSQVNY